MGGLCWAHRVAVAAGQPVVRQLLLDALRWWVTEYQVDGFCFVNAENLTQVMGAQRAQQTVGKWAIRSVGNVWAIHFVSLCT